jgi:hypothetical protein
MAAPRRRNTTNRKAKATRAPTRAFWSEAAEAGEPVEHVTITEDPTAVIRSLAAPPLNGRETIAEHYFEAVYTKAAALAVALAAADGVLDT